MNADRDGAAKDRDQMAANQSPAAAKDGAAGKGGILTLDLNHDLDLVPSGKAPSCSKAPPCTPSASGGEDGKVEAVGDGKRGPKPRVTAEGFERVRRRVASGESVMGAVAAEGMRYSTFYDWVHENAEWTAALREARQVKLVEALEDEVQKLVFEGEAKPIFWKGTQVSEERKFSDGLLIWLLKALAPEKYLNNKAAVKHREQLERAEKGRAEALVSARKSVDHLRGIYTEFLTRAGVPIPTRKKVESEKQASVISDQSSRASNQ